MPFSLSPSSINLFLECPRCFWLAHTKNIKRPAGIFPSLPSGMDRVLKEHFDRFAVAGKMPPELLSLQKEFPLTKLFDDFTLLNAWRNNWKGISIKDKKENTLKGAIDNLLINENQELTILDYKTRGYPLKEDTHEHYQNQLDTYNYLLQENNFKTTKHSYLLFYHPKTVLSSGEVEFNSNLIKMPVNPNNAKKNFEKAIKCLNTEKMPETKKDCEYCKIVDLHV